MRVRLLLPLQAVTEQYFKNPVTERQLAADRIKKLRKPVPLSKKTLINDGRKWYNFHRENSIILHVASSDQSPIHYTHTAIAVEVISKHH